MTTLTAIQLLKAQLLILARHQAPVMPFSALFTTTQSYD